MIDYRDPRPIFEQIAEHYKMLILRGILTEDEQMQSVRTLAAELSTNPNTVQKAYSLLESEGYVYSVKGRGAFVAGGEVLQRAKEKRIDDLAQKMREVLAEASALGIPEKELMKRAKHD